MSSVTYIFHTTGTVSNTSYGRTRREKTPPPHRRCETRSGGWHAWAGSPSWKPGRRAGTRSRRCSRNTGSSCFVWCHTPSEGCRQRERSCSRKVGKAISLRLIQTLEKGQPYPGEQKGRASSQGGRSWEEGASLLEKYGRGQPQHAEDGRQGNVPEGNGRIQQEVPPLQPHANDNRQRPPPPPRSNTLTLACLCDHPYSTGEGEGELGWSHRQVAVWSGAGLCPIPTQEAPPNLRRHQGSVTPVIFFLQKKTFFKSFSFAHRPTTVEAKILLPSKQPRGEGGVPHDHRGLRDLGVPRFARIKRFPFSCIF